eukprot:3528435-Pleurochrysis_carterae.AAC.1
MVLSRSQPSKNCSHKRKDGTYAKSGAQTSMGKLCRMGLAEGPSHGHCTGSIRRCYCDTMKHKHDVFTVAICDLVHPQTYPSYRVPQQSYP